MASKYLIFNCCTKYSVTKEGHNEYVNQMCICNGMQVFLISDQSYFSSAATVYAWWLLWFMPTCIPEIYTRGRGGDSQYSPDRFMAGYFKRSPPP